jgi:hypothetical protein
MRCMIRIHTTVDLLEAEILAGFLREHGVAAEVFDRDMVRQDWFRALAFGGYRVVVPSENADMARDLLRRWRTGEFDLEKDHGAEGDALAIERPGCVRCGSPRSEPDPWPRRWRLVCAYLLGLPILGLRGHYRCTDCGLRWREPSQAYAELARRADDAERAP